MSDEPDQFIPAGGERFSDDDMMRVIEEEAPGADAECIWQHFLAMQMRTRNPRRRIGGDCMAAAPMIFPPCQYTRRQNHGPDTSAD